MKHFARQTDPRVVSQNVLAKLLRTFREDRSTRRVEVDKRAKAILNDPSRERRYGSGDVLNRFRKRGIAGIEDESHGDIAVTYGELCFLQDVYQIDWPVVLSVLSVPKASVFAAWDDLIRVASEPAEDRGIEFCMPEVSLKDCGGVSVALLEIKPNRGESSAHRHPGEELLLVLKGAVRVRFLSTGVCLHVDAGSVLHFHSDQLHFTTAVGVTAKVLVVRFPRSKRRTVLVEKARRKQLSDADLHQLGRRSWQHHRMQLAETIFETPEEFWKDKTECADRAGLGQLLERLRSAEFGGPHGPLSIEALAAIASESELGQFNTARLYRLHHGKTNISLADAIALADIYKSHSLFFLDFFLPLFSPAIAIWPVDWIPIPKTITSGSGASYELPPRRLLDSEASITKLVLQPGGRTPENRHPGQEFLIPLNGAITIQISDPPPRPLSEGIAHFWSSDDHQVFNASEHAVTVLAIRYYGG